MAFIISSKFPVDTLPDVAVGVSIPFSGKAVFNQTFETKEALKSNIINYLLTGRGERFMKPNFGSGLRNELFQNINLGTLNELEFRIQSDLEIYFPSLQITNVNVEGDTDTNLINVSINFKVRDTLVEDEININFE